MRDQFSPAARESSHAMDPAATRWLLWYVALARLAPREYDRLVWKTLPVFRPLYGRALQAARGDLAAAARTLEEAPELRQAMARVAVRWGVDVAAPGFVLGTLAQLGARTWEMFEPNSEPPIRKRPVYWLATACNSKLEPAITEMYRVAGLPSPGREEMKRVVGAMGIEDPLQGRRAQHHFIWLVQYQILKRSYGQIAEEHARRTEGEEMPTDQATGKAVRELAKVMQITLRPASKSGRRKPV